MAFDGSALAPVQFAWLHAGMARRARASHRGAILAPLVRSRLPHSLPGTCNGPARRLGILLSAANTIAPDSRTQSKREFRCRQAEVQESPSQVWCVVAPSSAASKNVHPKAHFVERRALSEILRVFRPVPRSNLARFGNSHSREDRNTIVQVSLAPATRHSCHHVCSFCAQQGAAANAASLNMTCPHKQRRTISAFAGMVQRSRSELRSWCQRLMRQRKCSCESFEGRRDKRRLHERGLPALRKASCRVMWKKCLGRMGLVSKPVSSALSLLGKDRRIG